MKKKIVFSLLGMFIVLYAGWQFNRITERPTFCNSCHIMKPFVTNWETSSHNMVTCSKCHWGPGITDSFKGRLRLLSEMIRYALGAYNPQVRSKVKDQACLSCHNLAEISDTVYYFQKIPFLHTTHYSDIVRGIKTTCTTCHYELVQGNHVAVAKESCTECHFVGTHRNQRIKDCYTCHGPPKDEITVDGMLFNHSDYLKSGVSCNICHTHVTSGRGDVPRKACRTCHVERYEEYGESKRLHEIHVTNQKLKCTDCHTPVKHGKIEINPSITPECKVCHGVVHSPQEQMYVGIGAKDVMTIPDPMFTGGVVCYGCHTARTTVGGSALTLGSRLPKASGESCVSCHGKGYDKLLNMWQITIKQRLASIESLFVLVKPLKDKSKRTSKLINVIQHNLSFVKEDGSLGAHNIRYTLAILDTTEKDLAEILSSFGVSSGYGVKKNRVPEECRGCHPGINDRTIKVGNASFPHNVHTLKYPCKTCHSIKTHGKTLRKDCESCHHRQANLEERCVKCHGIQDSIYYGKFMGLNSPDVMAEEGVTCADCHISDDLPEKPKPEVCLDCHEEGYDETFLDWQKETRENLQIFGRSIDSLYNVIRKEGNGSQKSFQKYWRYRNILRTLKKDGSLGVHNIELFEELLNP